jgi:hypothetical protein
MHKYLRQPSMALNAKGATPYFQMENNYEVPESHTPEQIFDWVRTHALRQREKKLKALIIHSHNMIHDMTLGESSVVNRFLGIGQGISDSSIFARLKIEDKSLVDEIYLTGCSVAAVQGVYDGNHFCGEVAKHSGSMVYASTEDQWVFDFYPLRKWRPFGLIEYDGVLLRYKKDGPNELVVNDVSSTPLSPASPAT